MSNQEAACYTVVYEDSSEAPSTQDLRNALQKGSDEVKIDALRKIVVLTINGNAQVCLSAFIGISSGVTPGQPQLLMPIIQYCMPSRSKPLKKLLHFYWEVCPKYDENGKLKQEMILVV
jgi:coatomer subunit beta